MWTTLIKPNWLNIFYLTIVAGFVGLMISCSGSKSDYSTMFEGIETENYEAMTLAHMDDRFSTFAELIDIADLEMDMLFAEGFTLFMPTNAAFDKMNVGELRDLIDPKNKIELQKFLRRHIIPSEMEEADFMERQVIKTAMEKEVPITIQRAQDDILIGNAEIVRADVHASDGIIHVVNSLVNPTEDIIPG